LLNNRNNHFLAIHILPIISNTHYYIIKGISKAINYIYVSDCKNSLFIALCRNDC
jgi:hypothetical protein